MIELKVEKWTQDEHPINEFVRDEMESGSMTITVTPRPDLSDTMFTYDFTVKWNGFSYSGTYRMGMAYKTVVKQLWARNILWPGDTRYEKDNIQAPPDIIARFNKCRSLDDINQEIEWQEGITVKIHTPDPTDLIHSLAMDASVYEMFDDAWEMLDEFAGEPRDAQRQYDECVRTYKFLQQATNYKALQELTQDY